MAKYYIAQENTTHGWTNIEERESSPTPVGPVGALLCLLVGLAIVVLFVLAANEPNPGDADYTPPGYSAPQ